MNAIAEIPETLTLLHGDTGLICMWFWNGDQLGQNQDPGNGDISDFGLYAGCWRHSVSLVDIMVDGNGEAQSNCE